MKDAYKIGTEIENNHAIGKDPRKMSVEDLNAMGHTDRPLLKIIREKCLDCCGNNEAEVRRCTCVTCPLWPVRMSKNPMRSREISDEQRTILSERMAKARKTRMEETGD
jgi:hypothetical protein